MYSTAVWVGHPTSREYTGYGGPTAGPIWRSYMESAQAGNCPEFEVPSETPELSALDSGHTSGSGYQSESEGEYENEYEYEAPEEEGEEAGGEKENGEGGGEKETPAPAPTPTPTPTPTPSPGPGGGVSPG
jgi:membrane peptidoglycan carboxypeptidase